jgi:HSP20 family protein
MTEMTKRKKDRMGNGSMFPSVSDFFGRNFFSPRLFNEDLLEGTVNTPLANITETDTAYNVELSAPGLKSDDFKIDFEDGMLTISSEKEDEKTDEKKNYKRREYSYSSFSRSFGLPENILEDKIQAKYQNGVLNVTVPKKETTPSKPKKEIKVE